MKYLLATYLIFHVAYCANAQVTQDFESVTTATLVQDCWMRGGSMAVRNSYVMNGTQSLASGTMSATTSPLLVSPWLQLSGTGNITFRARATGTGGSPTLTVYLEERLSGGISALSTIPLTTSGTTYTIAISNTGVYRIRWQTDALFNANVRAIYDNIVINATDVANRATNPGDGNCECYPPNLDTDAAVAQEDDGSFIIDPVSNDTKTIFDIDPSTVTIISQPGSGAATSVDASGNISYTPVKDFNGVDTLIYQLCDVANICATDTVFVTLTAVNDAPFAINDTITVSEDSGPHIIDVLANDSDSIDTDTPILTLLSLSNGSAPATTGVVSNKASIDFPLHYFGTYIADYEMEDPEGAKASAKVVVIVEPVNDAPTVEEVTLEITTFEGSATLDMSQIVNDVDNAFTDLTITVPASSLNGGSVTYIDGVLTYLPAPGFKGTDEISITVTDSEGLSVTTTVYIKVDFEEEQLAISQGFSPNGDGINDYWHIRGIDTYSINQVTILNRWGDVVFQQQGYNNDEKAWRGQANSAAAFGNDGLPNGTYFYSLEPGNGDPALKGFVVINR
jgi:gliding motility-associated-like protein